MRRFHEIDTGMAGFRLWPGGLSARLLLFTAIVVTFGGLLILPPTLAAYEEQWLLDRVAA